MSAVLLLFLFFFTPLYFTILRNDIVNLCIKHNRGLPKARNGIIYRPSEDIEGRQNLKIRHVTLIAPILRLVILLMISHSTKFEVLIVSLVQKNIAVSKIKNTSCDPS